MKCTACGERYRGKGRFCPFCGVLLHLACPNCGQLNGRTNKACCCCSTSLSPPIDAASQASRTITTGRPLERRQLTIMFTDLVNSAALSDSMDPEDFRALIEAHRTAAARPIKQYEGVVARYLGDGMLVYFGYPKAHEDDPDRAVRAGLEIVDATKAMNARWVGKGRGRIAVRVGIHTGIVVVGDVIKKDVQEPMAVFGNAPTLSSRLQALAEPNSVVLSQATRVLLRPTVRCLPRGQTILKGMAEPVEIFMAGATDGRSIGDRISDRSRKVLPFVNREKELSALRLGWASAKKGVGKAFLLAGDPGIGKSRLIRALEERVVTKSYRWLVARTSPYAVNTDFFAFSELFYKLLQPDHPEDTGIGGYELLKAVLGEHGIAAPDDAQGFANLLGVDVPSAASPKNLQPEQLRSLTLEAITGWFEKQAATQALVLVIEDLHWADASTLEAIRLLLKKLPSNRILVVMSSRDPEILGGIKNRVETLPIERLPPDYARSLIEHVVHDAKLPRSAVDTLLERADGVPLFLEELPKPVLESRRSAGLDGDRDSFTLPATLRDSLMAQLDRIGSGKSVAQTGAVLGHSFEETLMRRVFSGSLRQMEEGLDALTDAGLLTRHGASPHVTYAFKHALLAEIAYDSLLRQERRQIHRRTADALVAHFPALTESRPELIARHYAAAGDAIIAFDYWMKAGKAAARRSANTEAIGHLRSAEAELEQLKAAGIEDLDERWLELHLAKAPVLIPLSGWSSKDVEDTYHAILQITEAPRFEHRAKYEAWAGLCNVYLLRGDLARARRTSEHMHKISISHNDKKLLLNWSRGKALCDFLAARHEAAQRHLSDSIENYEAKKDWESYIENGISPLVNAYSIKSWSSWFSGDKSEAEKSSLLAINLSNRINHPFSACYALCLTSSLAQCQGNFSSALRRSSDALSLSKEHHFPYWHAWACVVKGWSLAALDRTNDGLALLKEGLDKFDAMGAAQMRGYSLCLLAETYQRLEVWQDVVAAARLAIEEAGRTGIVFYEPEAHILLSQGLSMLDGNKPGFIRPLIRALRMAEGQRAVPLFLRASKALIDQADRKDLSRIIAAKTSTFMTRTQRTRSSA